MKRRYAILIILTVTTVVFLGTGAPCRAAEHGERPRREFQRREMSDEMVERMLEQLAERNPEKAKELKELREKDPEKFRAEFRRTMRELRQEFGGQRRERSHRERRGEHGGPGRGMRMRERYAEHLEWLEKNYPEEAKKLAELQKEKPELYMKQMAISLRKYRRIQEAEKDNPKLAKVLKEDLALKGKRNRLVRKIRAEENEDEKKKMTEELEKILNKRFDLILQRKQIAYEQLSEKLEKLKEEVKKSKESIEKWNDPKLKDEKVKTRLKELVTGEGKFRWE
jgi:hypothetical protein